MLLGALGHALWLYPHCERGGRSCQEVANQRSCGCREPHPGPFIRDFRAEEPSDETGAWLCLSCLCLAFVRILALVRRPYVLLFVELDNRRDYVTCISSHPNGVWVVQLAPNLSMVLAERAHPVRLLVRDRDAMFTSSCDEVFRSEGIRFILTPVRALRTNAFADRFVGTVRSECLDQLLIFGRHHLEEVLAEYSAHHNGHGPHRTLDRQARITG